VKKNGKDDDFVQTTVRLPPELSRQLKITAAHLDVSIQDFLISIIRQELERHGYETERQIVIPSTMTPALAELVLLSMPCFAVIKDRQARIEWINYFYEKELDAPLLRVAGRSFTEAGLARGFSKERIEANIRRTFKSGQPTPSIETMVIKERYVTVRAQRFVFNENKLGDISFIVGDIHERDFDADPNVILRMQKTKLDPRLETLFVPFLEAAPVAIAVKRPPAERNSVIVWANEAYVQLTGKKKAGDVIGRTTREVFRLPHDHPVLLSEARVAKGQARMSREKLPGLPERWSLRFPIFDHHGKVALIAVVSPDLLQDAGN